MWGEGKKKKNLFCNVIKRFATNWLKAWGIFFGLNQLKNIFKRHKRTWNAISPQRRVQDGATSPPSLAARCTETSTAIVIYLAAVPLWGSAGPQSCSFFWTRWEFGKKYIEERERRERFTCQQPTSHILLWSSKYKHKYKLSNEKIHVNPGGLDSSDAKLDPSTVFDRAGGQHREREESENRSQAALKGTEILSRHL